MKKHTLQVLGLLSTLLLASSRPSDANSFDVITLTGTNPAAGDHFGTAVSGAGDVNSDGIPDVIIGAPAFDDEYGYDSGRAYIFSSDDGRLIFELSGGIVFGKAVAGIGDVNRDGFDDVIVGAPNPNNDIGGMAYVYSGWDASLLFELTSPHPENYGVFGRSLANAGDVDLDGVPDIIVGSGDSPDPSPFGAGRVYIFSGQNATLLFELASPNEEQVGSFGSSVSGAGDINQDGVPDVIVGAWHESPGGLYSAGRAYAFSGHDGSLLFALNSPNQAQSGQFGYSVSGAGDANQDGFPDVIIGAPNESRAYLFSGHDGSLLFELLSPNEGDGRFGHSISGAGDTNQDGVPDVIVGAPYENNWNAGRAYIFSGADASLLFELVSPNPGSYGIFGWSVAAVGDANQDGFADWVVGASGESWDAPSGGRAYLFVSASAQPDTFRVNSGGPAYTDTSGNLFVPDQKYTAGSFGYIGGREHRFGRPIGGTDDDALYQDVRLASVGERGGTLSYRFDVSATARFDVTLYLMAPALSGAGNVVMDVQAEGNLVFDNLDVTAQAGGEYQALIKTFAVDVNDGTLDLQFRAVNKAAVVSAIAVVPQTQ